MAGNESANSDPIRKEPIMVDIENDIMDVTNAARATFALMESVLGNEEIRKKHFTSEEEVDVLFWIGGRLLEAVNHLNEKYYGHKEELVYVKEAANG